MSTTPSKVSSLSMLPKITPSFCTPPRVFCRAGRFQATSSNMAAWAVFQVGVCPVTASISAREKSGLAPRMAKDCMGEVYREKG